MKNVELHNSIHVLSRQTMQEQEQWITKEIVRIGEKQLDMLISQALKVREYAYCPYSGYKVGVAVLCASGKIYAAPNTEVVSYSQTGHAEHNAINKALSEGEGMNGRNFLEAVVVCHSGKSLSCGACRQEIAEHCENIVVIDVNESGTPIITTSLAILLPYAFTPKDLNL